MNLLASSVNGRLGVTSGLSLDDRGLHYGDGLFETMLARDGAIVALSAHTQRLAEGCERLGIEPPTVSILSREIDALLKQGVQKGTTSGVQVCKLIVTRAGSRGYRGNIGAHANRLLLLYSHALAAQPEQLTVRWCSTRLARNPLLAGMKHLNRLEQVLAQQEWQDTNIHEGLMMDSDAELVCATAGNVFAVIDETLCTPDLRFSGVRGTMRARVLSVARDTGIATQERSLRPSELSRASEVFVTNAVRGIRPVTALDAQRWDIGSVARKLAAVLQLW
jgi:4-amino-4-deoxychorismate lyase